MEYELRSARFLASDIRKRVVQNGDTVVDGTLGNGHDTLELAELVGPAGRVIGMDIQPEAVKRTMARLTEAGVADRCSLHVMGHEHMKEIVPSGIRYCCLNLGWLPGGDKSVTTHWETTRVALESALELLAPMGVLTVCVYPGHEAGAKELMEIQAFFASLRPQAFNCLRQSFLNAGPGSPECYVVQKQ